MMETSMPADQAASFRLRRSSPGVAIVGATGAVGRELLRVLEDRRYPLSELRLFSPQRSAGTVLGFAGREPMTPADARTLIADAPGVRLVDDWAANHFPMPSEASGQGNFSSAASVGISATRPDVRWRCLWPATSC
jgi:hypothetical protein